MTAQPTMYMRDWILTLENYVGQKAKHGRVAANGELHLGLSFCWDGAHLQPGQHLVMTHKTDCKCPRCSGPSKPIFLRLKMHLYEHVEAFGMEHPEGSQGFIRSLIEWHYERNKRDGWFRK